MRKNRVDHSAVWIFASSAEFTRRACWNSRSSSHSALCFFSSSQIALCSSANSACRRLNPTQPFSVKPVISLPVTGSTPSRPLGLTSTLPSRPARSEACVDGELP